MFELRSPKIFSKAYLNSTNAVLSSELPSIFQPADCWNWTPRCRTTKLYSVSCRDGIQLLLHSLWVGPVGACGDKHHRIKP